MVLRGQHSLQPRQGCRWLGLVDHPGDPLKMHIPARFGGLEHGLPALELAGVERFVRRGAVAQRVGFGVAQQVGDHCRAIRRNHVDRMVGHVAQHQRGGGDVLALSGPFGSEGLGEGLRRDQLCPPTLGLDRAAIERDLPAGPGRGNRNGLVEALHCRGVRQRRANSGGTSMVSASPMTNRT